MEKLDLTKILKDCITGTEFYSRFLGYVNFYKIAFGNYIEVRDKNGYYVRFKPNGTYLYSEEGTEIDLLPSKDQRDWSKWQRPFVDGDVIIDDSGSICIYKGPKIGNPKYFDYYCGLTSTEFSETNSLKHGDFFGQTADFRLATEEEKQKLFDAIKENGNEWDSEKKEIKKIESKFNILTLQPFDKVLVRGNNCGTWFTDIYSHFCEKNNEFSCVGGTTTQCVPYNDETKHLIGTTYKAPSKYIIW